MTDRLGIELRGDDAVAEVRRDARAIAEALGFEAQDQIRIATAVSELARVTRQRRGGGTLTFEVTELDATDAPQQLSVTVWDRAAAPPDPERIVRGRPVDGSEQALADAWHAARRLMDTFRVEPAPVGMRVAVTKALPSRGRRVTRSRWHEIARAPVRPPTSDLGELQRQNQELVAALEELAQKQEELAALNRELDETNRGVVALYKELDEKASQLARANDLKTRFLSNVTHELRTPINSVLGLTSLLLQEFDGPLTSEQRRQVGYVRTSAEVLSAFVNDLLDLAKIEAGRSPVHVAPVQIDNLFAALKGMFRPILTNPDVNLAFECPPGLGLASDESKLAQILRNLVSNAVKFTERGEIVVSAEQIGDTALGERVRFRVRDTGIGIARADQERVFEEFGQLRTHLHAKHVGTGLGLSLSRSLVRSLGGSITLESEPGVGSTFEVVVPARLPAPSSAEAPPLGAGPSHDRVPGDLLVVDDDPAVRYLVGTHFEHRGARVRHAATVAEAAAEVGRRRPDLVILDFNLPDGTAVEVTRALAGLDPEGRTPVIVYTARTLSDDERHELRRARQIVSKNARPGVSVLSELDRAVSRALDPAGDPRRTG